ncbi:MAG: putative signal transducing protein [Actinomycetota bacterium]
MDRTRMRQAGNSGGTIEQAYVANSLTEAHLIKGFLEAEGIVCEVRGEHLMAAYGEIPMTFDTLPSLWVASEDRLRARQRIEQALHGFAAGPEWVCAGCGEALDARFVECWQCGSTRSAT